MRNKSKHTQPVSNKKRLLVIASLLVLVAALTIGVLIVTDVINLSGKNTNVQSPENIRNGVNYNPPTEEEVEQTQQNKDKLAEEGNENGSQETTSSVQAILTRVDATEGSSVEAVGYANGIYENNGTCTYTFTKGSQKVVRTTKGEKDASTTLCTPTSTTLPSMGTWSVSLTYTSSDGTQTSQASNTIEVTI